MESPRRGRDPGDSRAVIVHLVSFVILTALVFKINEPALFLRFDGLMHLTEAANQDRWGGPLTALNTDFTKANGELSFAYFYRLNPAMLIARWAGRGDVLVWLASTILATMLFLSTLFLGFSVGFGRTIALTAAWLSCLLTLPYVVPVLTYIRVWGNQPFLAVMASSLLSLGLFFRLGRRGWPVSAAQAALLFALQFYAAISAPVVFATGVPAIGFFGIVALTMVGSRRELRHKIVAGLAVGLALIPFMVFVMELLALSKVTFFRRELDAVPMTFRDMSFFVHPHEEAGWAGPWR